MRRLALLLAIVCGFVAAAVLSAPALALPAETVAECVYVGCVAVYRGVRFDRLRRRLRRPRRAFAVVLLEQAGLGELERVQADAADRPEGDAQPERHRRHLELPAPSGLLVRHGDVRHAVATRLHSSTCTPDSDTNIFDGSNPAAADYIGKHPGTAFMEMQFYPPGWAPWPVPGASAATPTQWCAALNIDSLSENPNTGRT